jgi:hypothetical protein
MGLAYELTLATLRLSDRNDPVVQMIAERITQLAQTGERNPETLCQYALDGLLERERINAKPSNTDACITKLTQPKIKPDAPESPLE